MEYMYHYDLWHPEEFSNAFNVDPLRHLLGLSYIEMRITRQHLMQCLKSSIS